MPEEMTSGMISRIRETSPGVIFAIAAAAGLAVAAGCQQPAPPAPPPPPPAMALTASIKSTYDMVKDYLTRSLEQMPERDLGFKPAGAVKEVRTFGQIVGHLADSNYRLCGPASAEEAPSHDFEHTATSKAALQQALSEAFAYCDRTFASMNDQRGAEAVDTIVGRSTRLGALAFNNAHDFEHYGNLVTYMRAKGLIPPSSQPR
jgi:uncharacterized damage-inducible protein DinB